MRPTYLSFLTVITVVCLGSRSSPVASGDDRPRNHAGDLVVMNISGESNSKVVQLVLKPAVSAASDEKGAAIAAP